MKIPAASLSVLDAAIKNGTHREGETLHMCSGCRQWKVIHYVSAGGGIGASSPRFCWDCTPVDFRSKAKPSYAR